jgi:hypothetical protein
MHDQKMCSKKYKLKIQFFTNGLLANGLDLQKDLLSALAIARQIRLGEVIRLPHAR